MGLRFHFLGSAKSVPFFHPLPSFSNVAVVCSPGVHTRACVCVRACAYVDLFTIALVRFRETVRLGVLSAVFSRKPGFNKMSKVQRPQSVESTPLTTGWFSHHGSSKILLRLGKEFGENLRKKGSEELL